MNRTEKKRRKKKETSTSRTFPCFSKRVRMSSGVLVQGTFWASNLVRENSSSATTGLACWACVRVVVIRDRRGKWKEEGSIWMDWEWGVLRRKEKEVDWVDNWFVEVKQTRRSSAITWQWQCNKQIALRTLEWIRNKISLNRHTLLYLFACLD